MSLPVCMWISTEGGCCCKLQLLKSCVHSDNDSSPLNVRLVFDSCSQRSYVTQTGKDKLQLRVVGRDSLLIKSFEESDARLRTCEIVQVGIKTLCDATMYIQAYVVPVICGPLTQQSTELTQSSYGHLRNLPLAERAGGGVLAVSNLLGADSVWFTHSIFKTITTDSNVVGSLTFETFHRTFTVT